DLWHNLTVVQPASRGPGRPPAAKAAETRKRILRAAREGFSERGYDAATFQAIAVRADLTRPAINHYFANKRVLYWQVLDETNSAVVAASVQRARGETTLTRQVSAFIEGAIDAEIENRTAAAFFIPATLESQRHPGLRRPGGRRILPRRRGDRVHPAAGLPGRAGPGRGRRPH